MKRYDVGQVFEVRKKKTQMRQHRCSMSQHGVKKQLCKKQIHIGSQVVAKQG